ncbi:hypothetical protein F2P81_015879 [Scophthalmus maximus]|uniref:Uncharacterized protein n=1 Tax=Scophthalmus maximus TaxID=52904 RepID=A0A6A4SK06_SCOMX|nr:hypothetical protein F2P81_015879 [Scophthalmus maximus]
MTTYHFYIHSMHTHINRDAAPVVLVTRQTIAQPQLVMHRCVQLSLQTLSPSLTFLNEWLTDSFLLSVELFIISCKGNYKKRCIIHGVRPKFHKVGCETVRHSHNAPEDVQRPRWICRRSDQDRNDKSRNKGETDPDHVSLRKKSESAARRLAEAVVTNGKLLPSLCL